MYSVSLFAPFPFGIAFIAEYILCNDHYLIRGYSWPTLTSDEILKPFISYLFIFILYSRGLIIIVLSSKVYAYVNVFNLSTDLNFDFTTRNGEGWYRGVAHSNTVRGRIIKFIYKILFRIYCSFIAFMFDISY